MDAYLNLILLLVSVFLMTTEINCNDPCGIAREIYDPFRSTVYKLKRGKKALCDKNLRHGWYKFKGGLKIPTTKPAPLHCGTFAPIWMRGNLPTTVGKTVEAEACVNLFNIRNGCSSTLHLSVRLCKGNVYVYKLSPPRGCAMAYCAGSTKPCPSGTEGIFPNCKVSHVVAFPESLVPLPYITYGRTKVLQMVCSFDFPAWNNVSYLVEWYAHSFTSPVLLDSWCEKDENGNFISDCTRRQSLMQFRDHFVIGDTVGCRLKMKYSNSAKNDWTEFGKESKQYYVGIEVSPRHIIVKECKHGRNQTVTLTPTVPITGYSDAVTVWILIPEEYKAQKQQAAVDKCTVDLTSEDIMKGKSITIRGICDNLNEDRQSLLFHFSSVSSNFYWSEATYRMPSLKITVDNTNSKSCRSTSDPYLHSFASKSFAYNEPGDFLMYRNNAQKVEVHVRAWTCTTSKATCACGVAIREGKDVIELTICNNTLVNEEGYPTKLFVRKKSPGRLSHGIQVIEKFKGRSLEHEVILSSGTRVRVYRYARTLDIYVYAPDHTDEGNSDGLCGKINGDPNDIFKYGGDGESYNNQETFSRSWLLKNESYLGEKLPKDERESEQERFCFCSRNLKGKVTNNNCNTSANHFKTVEEEGRQMQRSIDTNDSSSFGMGISKRSVENHWYSDDIINQEYRSFFVADNDVENTLNRIRSKRSASYTKWPEERAKRYCTKLIKGSEAEKTCRKLDSESVESAIGQCINDLVLSGNEDLAILAFDAMKVVCEETALTNLSLYTQNSNGELTFSKEIVQDLCPSDCSEHGKCKNRTCICDEGFTALDCSMDVNAVPDLLGIYNGGLCDIRERPCKKTDLLGQNFINSNNLTCHVKEFKIYPGSWSPRGVPVTTHGKMTDIFGVKCDLPEPPTRLGDYDHEGTPAAGVLVAVSNDGFNASAIQLRHVTYDSKCMKCTNSKCELKANSCLIRGHCFAANEPNPRDWCQQCLPRDDQNSWTRRKNNQAPKFTTKTTMFALRGEDLVIKLKATDPDNRPVTYSVLNSTATGYSLSSSGLLRWNITSNEKFTFQVTDECGAFDTTDMRVRIVQCPCLNGGQCIPDPYHPRGSGKYQCKCKEKFSGELCEMCKGVKNNKPPTFTSQKKLFALQGEDLSLQLKAEDPEKLNITYSLLSSTATGHTLSSSGLLKWKVTSNSSLTIKVTDECDGFDTLAMTVRIVQCPCFNGGKCVPHRNHPRGSGKYQCKCVNGFRGERCERCPGFVCPPRNVTVKAIGSTKIEVNWLGPSDNLVTYYFVKYAQLPYRFRRKQVPKTITTKTLNNLKKFTDYRVGVSVVNRYGEKTVETMIKTGEDVPDAAPVITAVSPVRYDTVFVRWSPIPKDKRNGIIVGYKIYYRQQYTDDAWNTTTTSSGDLTSTTATGLQPYTEHCVKMSAFTSKGEYPDWNRKQCYTVKTPSLPIKVSGEGISQTEILLRFEKPKRSTSSNKVQVDYGKQKDRLKRKKACYGSSCVIDKLEPDTLYYFKVIGYVYQRGETPSFTQIRTLSRSRG